MLKFVGEKSGLLRKVIALHVCTKMFEIIHTCEKRIEDIKYQGTAMKQTERLT